ncbi:MAG: flagellar export protein FliJ [Planctomycetes bacterium]|nr:flagellar export protein FliJ [Planctomycetota bacterium]
MAKFRFRLATLQKLRETHRDEMRSKLAEAYQAERLLDEQADALDAEEAQLQQVHRNTLQTGTTDVNRLLDVQRYSATLKGQLATIQEQSKMLASEIEKRRLALVVADQQVRVLEKLCERQLDAHRSSAMRAEAKIMDEIASRPQEVDL